MQMHDSEMASLDRSVRHLKTRVSTLERGYNQLQHIVILAVIVAGAYLLSRGPSWVQSVVLYAAIGLTVFFVLKHWIDGWLGRGQWPSPHGRYYNRWLRLGPKHDDYYPWLAEQKGNREPWRTWVELERNADE
jgi:hypothetical protein